MKRGTRRWVVGVVIGVVAIGLFMSLILGIRAAKRRGYQRMRDPYCVAYSSPAYDGAELWLVEEGLVDRGKKWYIKPPGETAIPFTTLNRYWPARWSKDGKVVAFLIEVDEKNAISLYGAAYDFSKREAVLPLSYPYTIPEWQENEKKVMDLVNRHGGFSDISVDGENFDKDKRSISYQLLAEFRGHKP